MRLSLCLIARNEEAMLPGLLASVEGVVDEIVLVDTGSTDATLALARAAGATVLEQPWNDDFAQPRTTAIQHASGDWVLQLDADERLAPGAGRALRQVLQRRPTFDCGLLALHNAASLDADPRHVVAGHQRLSDAAWLPRLLRRVDGLRYTGVIHESVLEWVHEHDLTIARVPGIDVVHLGAVPSLRSGRGKAERNIALLRKRCALEPDSVLPFGYLALELVQADRVVEAQAVVDAGWALIGSQPKHRSAIRLAVARGLLRRGRPARDRRGRRASRGHPA
jgi:glycosyltransferase involved in cell wall biosynthesis